jgi:hypothetical protein
MQSKGEPAGPERPSTAMSMLYWNNSGINHTDKTRTDRLWTLQDRTPKKIPTEETHQPDDRWRCPERRSYTGKDAYLKQKKNHYYTRT